VWIHNFIDPDAIARSEADFYRRLAEESLGLMCCHDLEGVLLWINPAAAESLGYSPEEGVGIRLDSFLAPEVRPMFTLYLARIRAKRVDAGVMRLLTRGGDQRIWMYRNVLSDAPELPPHVLGHALDITARVKAETEIRDLNAQLEVRIAERTAELERSNADLREFAHVASHDLQAPLKQVRQALSRLAIKSNGPESVELLRGTQSNIDRMSKLIDGLLSYALVSSQTITPVRRVLLRTAIEESLMNLASMVETTGASVVYESLPEIQVEEAAFVQLFQNLIGNAINYRGDKPPSIRISVEPQDDFWIYTVEDNGIGIDPVYSEKIFHAFSRLHGKEYVGTGIGLAICKKVVERMGGRIWVESGLNHGSTFRFTIPR
jgi:PAS domain S-box-containing protein